MGAKVLSKAVTGMKTSFWSSIGAKMVAHNNGGQAGAQALTKEAIAELQAFYFNRDMNSFFGFKNIAIVASHGSGNWHTAWYANGWVKGQNGYDVICAFNSDSPFSYSDSACRDGEDAHNQATCLYNEHHASSFVMRVGRRRYKTFWGASWLGPAYFKEYNDHDMRLVMPGSSAALGLDEAQNHTESSLSGSSSSDDEPDLEDVDALPRNSGQLVVTGSVSIPSDPSSIMKDISNVFETTASIAEFFGPEGEVVGLVASLIAGIFSLIAGLLGMNQPDPVIQALREFEHDIMGKLTAVSDNVQKAKSQAALGAVDITLNNAEVPLLDIIGYWNALYPQGSKNGQVNQDAVNLFKISIGGNIAKYRDAWTTLTECLSGKNQDCILQGRSALEIILYNGQTYPRPLVLTKSLQYYFILAQKSAVAICAYSQLVLGDKSCAFMPKLKDNMQAMAQGMKTVTSSMRDAEFRSQMGSGKAPGVIKYFIDQHANGGADGAAAARTQIQNELQTYYFADGLFKYFDALQYSIIIQHSKSSGSGNWKSSWSASGWMQDYNGYDTIYSFNSLPSFGYKDSDCRSGEDAQAQKDCLQKMHGAPTWVARVGRRRFKAFYSFGCAGCYGVKYPSSGVDARVVTPGSKASQGLEVFSEDVIADSDVEVNGTTLVV